MLSFVNDYSEGAHPRIIEKLSQSNLETLAGYGFDKYTESAKTKIKQALNKPDAEIFLLAGGTQTNMVVVSALLRNYEGVICAKSGHVNGHEAGAIELTGHKVISISQHDGKIGADDLKRALSDFYADANHEHMTFPGLAYVSQPTEYGTLYSKKELSDIYAVCREYKIQFYVDGARLGYALATEQNDATISDLAELCDVFYIGGTKCGALIGEAVVFTHANMPPHFMTTVKQHGALLAKGRILGVQFDVLFTDGLYEKICRNAIVTADKIKIALKQKGYKFFIDSPTNQIFIVIDNEKLKRLSSNVAFGFWEKADESHTVVRIATSWATTMAATDQLISLL